MSCPACGGRPAGLVLRQERVPVLQNRVWPTLEQALQAPTGTLALTWCARCDHIWNAAFDPDAELYDPSYDNRQDASPAFRDYLSERMEALAEHVAPGDTIVEIGCGQGAFLEALCARAGTTGRGFDPSFRGGATADGVRSTPATKRPPPER